MKVITKEDAVTGLKKSFESATAVIFADYKGVTSEEMNTLRRSLRDKKVVVKVAKNNLVRVALKGTSKEQLVEKLAGPTVTFFAQADAVEMAKALTDYAKKVEAFSIKEGMLGDQAMSEAQIKQLATLPSREQLLSQLLSVMNGPIRNFVCVLNAVPRDFTRVVHAIAEKKGQQG
ncbi:MAG: 50S ribosomal protein L10 [Bdellovibrionota bacterium]